MILKAFIKELPKKDSNVYRVRVPFLEDNTNHEMVFDALLCNQPGEYYGYKVGDCVFVIFENDKMNTPVIMGKLYTYPQEDSTSYHVVNELNITGKVTLPNDTVIGGYSAQDFFKLSQGAGASGGGAALSYELFATWEDTV